MKSEQIFIIKMFTSAFRRRRGRTSIIHIIDIGCVCECVCVRERVCVCVWMSACERERDRVCVCVQTGKKDGTKNSGNQIWRGAKDSFTEWAQPPENTKVMINVCKCERESECFVISQRFFTLRPGVNPTKLWFLRFSDFCC
jgi:hypothetical protein